MPAERLLQPTLINAAASGFDGIFDASTAEPNTHMLTILDNKLYTVVNLHQLLIIIIIIIIIINFFFSARSWHLQQFFFLPTLDDFFFVLAVFIFHFFLFRVIQFTRLRRSYLLYIVGH